MNGKCKKDEIKINVTLENIKNSPLVGGWEYICYKYEIPEWCLNENLDKKDEIVKISLFDAAYIGLVDLNNLTLKI